MSNTTNSTTFSFVEALTPKGSKSVQAQEFAIDARIDLQAAISNINGEIKRIEEKRQFNYIKANRSNKNTFKAVLGDLNHSSVDVVVDAYKTFKNNEASASQSSDLEIADLVKERTLLEEVLAMYPENTDTIVVEEVKA